MEKTEKPKKEKKPKVPKPPKPPKEKKTESQLVHQYANRVIKNQVYHGRVDSTKFKGLEHNKSVSKEIWTDTDFYFSIVFQTSDQKYQVLEFMKQKFGIDFDSMDQIQIVNGLKFAKALGMKVEAEQTADFPLGNLDLMPFALDNQGKE